MIPDGNCSRLIPNTFVSTRFWKNSWRFETNFDVQVLSHRSFLILSLVKSSRKEPEFSIDKIELLDNTDKRLLSIEIDSSCYNSDYKNKFTGESPFEIGTILPDCSDFKPTKKSMVDL